ncbi:hypothetical protein MMC21_002244 [Puttea exsequens]|nr:hypothetical protein [Puttea exsequens]
MNMENILATLSDLDTYVAQESNFAPTQHVHTYSQDLDLNGYYHDSNAASRVQAKRDRTKSPLCPDRMQSPLSDRTGFLIDSISHADDDRDLSKPNIMQVDERDYCPKGESSVGYISTVSIGFVPVDRARKQDSKLEEVNMNGLSPLGRWEREPAYQQPWNNIDAIMDEDAPRGLDVKHTWDKLSIAGNRHYSASSNTFQSQNIPRARKYNHTSSRRELDGLSPKGKWANQPDSCAPWNPVRGMRGCSRDN